MTKRLLTALLVLLLATSVQAANVVPWVDVMGGYEGGVPIVRIDQRGVCKKATFTSANETDDTQFLYVGGSPLTLQVEGDAAGLLESIGYLYACTSPLLSSCGNLNVIDSNANGLPDTSTIGDAPGGRGTLSAFYVAGYLYAEVEDTSMEPGEKMEVMLCTAVPAN